MSITYGRGLPWCWGATASQVEAAYPCDAWASGPILALTRAIDVAADSARTYRWMCQLRIAPYSYDWVDNLGRRSPQTLTPGAENLARGQRFMIGPIVSFAENAHITVRAEPLSRYLFGVESLTYCVQQRAPSRSRIVVRLNVENKPGVARRVRRTALAWGDLIMMRRQLQNLRRLVERPGNEFA